MFAIVRLYEYVIVRQRHAMPDGAAALVMRGLLGDLAVTVLAGALLALPILALARVAPRAAERTHRAILVIIAIVAVMLSQYFSLTFVPLGADFFGYSWADIRETTTASGGGGLSTVIPLVVVGAIAWWLTGVTQAASMPGVVVVGSLVALVAAIALRTTLIPPSSAFASRSAYFVSTSKTAYFASAAASYLSGSRAGRASALTGYPLLHAASHDDVLGPLLATRTERPNIVFVVVEGLGRDFVGKGARYGGFMPFLDSLTERSLYWENFLSSSGRTFGVLPGLLASLPYGNAGFMSLGAKMPNHQSLVSILGTQGYATNYFTAGDGHFDFIDTFMERQGIGRFVDESNFGADYVKAPASVGGASWGYADADLFKRSFELLGAGGAQPRLDIYLTMTSHEPFIPPREADYRARFETRLAGLAIDDGRRAEMRRYANVFTTLLYTDDALAYLVHQYEQRPEFAHTMLVITGDHRIIPIPEQTEIDRFRVPFLIYSPMVKAPRTMRAVSSHLDVVPSLLALLEAKYGVDAPDSVAWLGVGIDTAVQFRSTRSVPLMRTKNGLDSYLDGTRFLAGEDLYRVEDGLRLIPESNAKTREELHDKLDAFAALNDYVIRRDRLYPGGEARVAEAAAMRRDDSAFAALRLDKAMGAEQLYARARETAAAGDRRTARVIVRKMLRDSPNNHDARALLGRTFAWDSSYDSARVVLRELLRRGPDYADGYAALADVEIWSLKPAAALIVADSGLRRAPRDAELLLKRARSLELLNRTREARAAIDALLAVDPANAEGLKIRARLK